MTKVRWLLLIILSVAIGIVTSNNLKRIKKNKKSAPQAQVEASSYWTCPMHPQIHQNHPGECPICHMKLVKVSNKPRPGEEQNQNETRSDVEVGANQLVLMGVQKHEVEKMTIRFHIPISGRFISSSQVAFQIYESDLRYIRPGLTFSGESSFYPEEYITGKIVSVDPIVDPTSRTIRVVGSVYKGTYGNSPETGFHGDIMVELHDRLAIPESSVLHTGNADMVYIFSEGNKLSPRTVKLGLKSEGFYDVLQGLRPGDIISSGPNFLIDSEAKIRGAGEASDHKHH